MATNTFDEADTGAGLLNKASGRYARAGKVEEGRGDAVGRGEFIECRSVVPTGCCKGGVVAYGLVGEEGKDVVFPDGAAEAAMLVAILLPGSIAPAASISLALT